MRLDPDCIRDILIDVENFTSPGKFYEYKPGFINPDFKTSQYDSDTVIYHIKQCELSGYFTEIYWTMDKSCMIIDLTPVAHQFLADIREDTNWNKTKEISKNVGSNSLNAIKEIATGVISSLIQKQLGL